MEGSKTYEHVISLGHFCAVASELEKLGLRESSMPFDWVISPFDSIITLIDNHFTDFLNTNYLFRDDKSHYIVINNKYNIAFYHDFKENKSIEEQANDVINKYNRRIDRFYKYVKERTLFVRYIETIDEYNYIKNNYDYIMSVLKKHNDDNSLILIAKEIKGDNIYTIYDKDAPYKTPQKFVKINKNLYRFFINLPYPIDKKRLNLKRYRLSLPKRTIKYIKKTLLKIYRKFH